MLGTDARNRFMLVTGNSDVLVVLTHTLHRRFFCGAFRLSCVAPGGGYLCYCRVVYRGISQLLRHSSRLVVTPSYPVLAWHKLQ